MQRRSVSGEQRLKIEANVIVSEYVRLNYTLFFKFYFGAF